MALVHYHAKNVLTIGFKDLPNLRLIPGINEVEDNVLKEAKKHKLFQARIEKKLITILNEKTEADGKRSVAELLENMPQVFDVKFLRKLIENDGRPAVVKAAQQQMDLIKNPAKAKELQDEHFA